MKKIIIQDLVKKMDGKRENSIAPGEVIRFEIGSAQYSISHCDHDNSLSIKKINFGKGGDALHILPKSLNAVEVK